METSHSSSVQRLKDSALLQCINYHNEINNKLIRQVTTQKKSIL